MSSADSPQIRYSWLTKARILMLDVFSPPVYPWVELEVGKLIEVMERVHANTVRLPSFHAYCYYNSNILPKSPEANGRDIIAEVVEACHSKGFKVIPYIPALQAKKPYAEKWQGNENWAALHGDGSPIMLPHGTGIPNSDVSVLCLRSGARESLMGCVREIVSNYDVDVAYFDGPVIVTGTLPDGFCHCPRCKEAFEKEEGMPAPETELYDWNDPVSVKHCLWQRNDAVKMMGELYDTVKRIRDIPVIFNWLDHGAGRIGRGSDIVKHSDGFLVEAGEDFASKLYTSKLGHNLNKVVLSYVGNFNPWARYRVGNDEIHQEGCAILAGGGTPIVSSGPSCYYNPNDSDPVKRLFSHIERLGDVVTGSEDVKFIALPYSQHSADWHFRSPGENFDFKGAARNNRYDVYHQGMSRMLIHTHQQFTPTPYTVLSDVEALKHYPLVVLSNAACMTDDEATAIRDYVAQGGSLLATYDTSLYGQFGEIRDDFALSDVLGVSLKGRDGIVFEKYMTRPPDGSGEIPIPDGCIPSVEYNIVETSGDRKVAADIRYGQQVVAPGIVYGHFGMGKVVYVASGIDRMYQDGGIGHMSSRVTDFLTILSSIIDWLSDGKVPFRTDANRGVIANLTEKPGNLLLHLINYNGANLEKAHCQIDAVIPINGIQCSVRKPTGATCIAVNTHVLGTGLEFREDADTVSFKVPDLRANEIVEIGLRR